MVESQRVIKWNCNFEIRWYPFGIQKCDMIFYIEDENIILEAKNISYQGIQLLYSFSNHLLIPPNQDPQNWPCTLFYKSNPVKRQTNILMKH